MLSLDNGSEIIEIPNARAAFQSEEQIDMSCSEGKLIPETRTPPLMPESRTGLSSDAQTLGMPYRVFPSFSHKNDDVTAGSLKKHDLATRSKANSHTSPGALMHSSPSQSSLGPRMKIPVEVDKKRPQLYVQCGAFLGYNSIQGLENEHRPRSCLRPLLPSTLAEDLNFDATCKSNSPLMQQVHTSNGSAGCKLFGISLNSSPVAREQGPRACEPLEQVDLGLDCVQNPETNLLNEGSKFMGGAGTLSEPGKAIESSGQIIKDMQGKQQAGFMRSCVKVIYQPFYSH